MLVSTQQVYRGTSSWPWMSLVTWWQQGPALHGYANSSIDALLAVGSLVATGWLFRRHPPEYWLFALAAVLVPLSSGLVSFSRMLLAAPVLAIPVAASLPGVRTDTPTTGLTSEDHRNATGHRLESRRVRPSWLLLGWLATSLLGLAWFSARFATWQWVA